MLRERGIVRGGQHAGRPHRAGDEARALGGAELVGGGARQSGGGHVDLVGARAQGIVVQLEARTGEGVGFEHVGAGGQIGAMDVADGVGPGQREDFGAAILASPP